MAEKNPYFGATFAERKAIREAAEDKSPDEKAVQEAENKSVTSATRKRRARKS